MSFCKFSFNFKNLFFCSSNGGFNTERSFILFFSPEVSVNVLKFFLHFYFFC